MITYLHTWNFRMLPANRVALGPFQVLVGQNATGKSTFLAAFEFVSRVLREGAKAAVERAAPSFHDLCFEPSLGEFGFAVGLRIANGDGVARPLRYEVEVGLGTDADTDAPHRLRVLRESLFLLPEETHPPQAQLSLFPPGQQPPYHESTPRGWRKVVAKTPEGKDYFRDEKTDWNNVFKFGVDRAALGSLPEDPNRFALSIAARDALRDGPRLMELIPPMLRAPSPPGRPNRMALDGSNLPHVVAELQRRDPTLFADWIGHLRTGIAGLHAIDVWERPEDKHLVLRASFAGSEERFVPSWLLSDGSLRLMALTLLSYASTDADQQLVMIEEPENGLHPLAIQAAFTSLANPPLGTQVLLATHSPIFLAQVQLDQILVFRRAAEGFASIRRGTEVTELNTWQGGDLSNLFVTGVLG